MERMVWCKFTPLEFETTNALKSSYGIIGCKFTPLEFETKALQDAIDKASV